MTARLYVVNGSHPCATVQRALEMKGIDYKIFEWPPTVHVPAQWLLFRERTVPAIKFDDGEKISGSRKIVKRLEELRPDPPLFPADADARAKVEEAERWGDLTLQPLGRTILWPAFKRSPKAAASFTPGSKIPTPGPMANLSMPVISRLEVKLNDTGDEVARRDLQALPGYLDKVDAWIAEGVLGGEPPNAADLQIATSLRLLMTLGDVRPMFEGRPAERLAFQYFDPLPGEIPAGTFPADWLPA
jgi:glutathione S-transferase